MGNLCTVKRKEGRWVSSIDISKKNDDAPLQISRHKDAGECKKECIIGRAACRKALGGKEEVVKHMLKNGNSVVDMRSKICKKSCVERKLPKLEGWQDETFVARNAAVVAQEDALPPGMQAYNAKDILDMSESDQQAFFADQAYKRRIREERETREREL